MIWIILIIIMIALDQVTKILVVNNMNLGDRIQLINGVIHLSYHENTGATLGLLPNGRYFFIVITFILLGLLAYYFIKMDNLFFRWSVVLIIGGAIGNLIDRIIKGSVTDFLAFDFYIAIFNFADIFIQIGTIMLAIYILFVYKENDEKKENIRKTELTDNNEVIENE